MEAADFAEACREERDLLLANYSNISSGSVVAELLASAHLSPEQKSQVVSALDAALTDAFYTILLAIDGAAALGQTQCSFILADDQGKVIANGDGRLEAAAWEALQSGR